MEDYGLRGYLLEDHRLFYLKDSVSPDEIEYHYHDFHKVLLFMGGSVIYAIEGTHYPLERGDVVLIPRGCVHRPEIGRSIPYERYVLYISPAFLHGCSEKGGCDLELCLRGPGRILRLGDSGRILSLFESFKDAAGYGEKLFGRLLAQQLMIELCRASLSPASAAPGAVHDPKIAEILGYINANLTEDISADALSARFYISKYHMMRRFRNETGYSIHSYVSCKRLMLARDLITEGIAATKACYSCGYRDYSAFARAYIKQFGVSPGKNCLSR